MNTNTEKKSLHTINLTNVIIAIVITAFYIPKTYGSIEERSLLLVGFCAILYVIFHIGDTIIIPTLAKLSTNALFLLIFGIFIQWIMITVAVYFLF